MSFSRPQRDYSDYLTCGENISPVDLPTEWYLEGVWYEVGRAMFPFEYPLTCNLFNFSYVTTDESNGNSSSFLSTEKYYTWEKYSNMYDLTKTVFFATLKFFSSSGTVQLNRGHKNIQEKIWSVGSDFFRYPLPLRTIEPDDE